MELQKLVTTAIEAMGGIVVPVEYALCQVVVPEEYKDLFQGRDELEVAFDFEVAEENPQAEFVTFGSYLFDQIMGFVRRQAVSTVRFADIDPPALSGPLDKIRRFMAEERGTLTLRSERPVMGAWAVFSFRIGYVSDEKEEEFCRVWVDMTRGALDEDMGRSADGVPYADTPVHALPVVVARTDVPGTFRLALEQVTEVGQRGRLQRVRQAELERERKRIVDYYDELSREIVKRSGRKGLTEEKRKELLDKARSVELERQKQLAEIEKKYDIRVEPVLDHGVVVMAPLLEYVVSISERRVEKEFTVYYNPILKRFSVIPGDYP
ncbi:OmpH family outer membrane protein [Kyrpidia spormannii]|uniref:Uncharacterized protein n=2 Tax=Kyrpidia spormannii TaxID=2055160 RepID=A0ACA8Z552_9BACL|nr:OmpH family outer membrane protein [Kyrpidia spormannii]CAB3389521.1 conserved protein of unknown function [Kyrpidia spormannii]CAB3390334.1 conserved protein of unknown function [Kyrpidia spormannii]